MIHKDRPQVVPQPEHRVVGIHQKRVGGPASRTSHTAPIRCRSLFPASDAELALDGIDGAEHALVLRLHQAADFADRADDRGVVLASKALA